MQYVNATYTPLTLPVEVSSQKESILRVFKRYGAEQLRLFETIGDGIRTDAISIAYVSTKPLSSINKWIVQARVFGMTGIMVSAIHENEIDSSYRDILLEMAVGI